VIEDKFNGSSGVLEVSLRLDAKLEKKPFVEVRDSSLQLVERSSNRSFNLPEGLYEVSAVLEDGQKHSALVQVASDTSTPVVLEAGNTLEAERSAWVSAPPSLSQSRPFTQFSESVIESPPIPSEVDVQFLECKGATLLRSSRNQWTFDCKKASDQVPTATFAIGSRQVLISLPVSPSDFGPSNSCTVRADHHCEDVHLDAWISPERTLANAMQNMLASGRYIEAAHVAEQAIDLLRSKYQDPTGAVLGALILQKVGRLQRLQSWIENLVRDFPWLPDAKVLLASLMVDEGNIENAVILLIQASKQRMLLSESFSLLLDLLRRLPGAKTRENEQRKAIGRLTLVSPYIDWQSTCLNHYKED
jgi:hypothetical protein